MRLPVGLAPGGRERLEMGVHEAMGLAAELEVNGQPASRHPSGLGGGCQGSEPRARSQSCGWSGSTWPVEIVAGHLER